MGREEECDLYGLADLTPKERMIKRMHPRKFINTLMVVRKLIWVIAGIYGFIFLLLVVFDVQRQHFGKSAGTVLIIIESTVPFIICLGHYFWKRKRRRELIAAVWIWSGIMFGFLGWFVHPIQIYERAIDRYYDWKKSGASLEESIRESKSKEKAFLYPKRFQEELYARSLELKAAEVRFHGEPQFFRSAFFTCSLFFFSLVCFFSGIVRFIYPSENGFGGGSHGNPP